MIQRISRALGRGNLLGCFTMQKLLVFTSIVFFVGLKLFGDYTVNWVDGYQKGNRRRLLAVLRMECFLTLLNVLSYNQLLEWFDEDIIKEKSYEKKRLQNSRKKWANVLIIFLAAGQAIYFMYYAPNILQFLFFDFTSICAGIWTNLIFFVVGFWLANHIKRLMLKNRITSDVLELLSRLPLLYNLVWCRKSQIKFSIICTLILSTAMYVSKDWIVIKHKTIHIHNLTAINNNMRLAVISDLHAGASVYRSHIQNVVDKVMETNVDAILVVGDLVDGTVEDIGDRVEPILKLPLHAPTFFVTGNHEYYYGNVDEWLKMYTKAGINVMDNKGEMFKGICLAGVNDISSPKSGATSRKMDIKKALENCENGKSKIVMAHNPASVKEFQIDDPEDFRNVDLVISGHTHAGQFYVVIPVVYWLLPYFYGLYDITQKTQLMVTAGSLYQGPPMKMIGMSEVWILELIGK